MIEYAARGDNASGRWLKVLGRYQALTMGTSRRCGLALCLLFYTVHSLHIPVFCHIGGTYDFERP